MKKSLRGNLQAFLLRVHLLRCRNIKWAKGECVLNQIVFAAGVLLFPALRQWVTPAEAHVYETAAKLLTELFLEN